MRKTILLTLFAILSCLTEVAAQNNKEIYIIFDRLVPDSTGRAYIDKIGGIYHSDLFNNNEITHYYSITKRINMSAVYGFTFFHKPKKHIGQTIEIKLKSYLEELKSKGLLVDWDEYFKTATDEQLKAYVKTFWKYDKIYFIDRADFTKDSIKIIQAKLYIPYGVKEEDL